MEQQQLQNILEAILLSAETPLKVPQIEALFAGETDIPTRDEIRQALHELGENYQNRGFELKQVASGFRIQVRQEFAPWVGRLWEEKPARYTRALLETLALIAYRQPITRGEIEEVRGVSVSSNIIKTLIERDWVKVLGHKDVPGKPALYGTTNNFLDYFNLKSLDELPTLAELKDLDNMNPELELGDAAPDEPGAEQAGDESQPDENASAESAEDAADDHAREEPSDEARDPQDGDADNTQDGAEPDGSEEVANEPGRDAAAETGHEYPAAEAGAGEDTEEDTGEAPRAERDEDTAHDPVANDDDFETGEDYDEEAELESEMRDRA